jgi:type II secretory pathway component PulC
VNFGSSGRVGVWAWRCCLAFAGACIIAGALLVGGAARLPVPDAGAARPAAPRGWPVPVAAGQIDWSAFVAGEGEALPPADSAAARFRLAGTFFQYGIDGADVRRAVLDDLSDGTQAIVAEGDLIGRVRVVRVLRDAVVLETGSDRVTLKLSFTASTGGRDGPAGGAAGGEGAARDSAPDRFGLRRVGEYRWVFDRERLLAYYQELMDEPERLVRVFDTLKPLYDADRAITGYQVGLEGEAAFFRATGLREGDVVRKVNSLPMTNRRRAEYFIKEFVADRANAFVLDIERDGEARKLIYQVR